MSWFLNEAYFPIIELNPYLVLKLSLFVTSDSNGMGDLREIFSLGKPVNGKSGGSW